MATITQWQILKTLTKHKQGTQKIRESLANVGINLTLRSVQRNLEKLSQTFQITSDELNPAGWKWADDCELLDLPLMDTSTALTLRMAEQYLVEMMPKGCVDTLQPYMRHAHKLLDEASDLGIGEWPHHIARISRQQQLITPLIKADVLDEVFQAVLEKKQLAVHYQGLSDEEPVKRELHPLGLVFDSGVIYLVATVWNYHDVRQFALHRMVEARMLDTRATRDESFCLDKYIAEGNFDFPRTGGLIGIRLLVNDWLARHLEERKLSEDQSITKMKDGFLVEASVMDTVQLQWWLLGQGTKVEVLDPPSLRQSLRKTIEKLHATYGDDK
ncbi:MAG: WYL domain-containing protein [Desulfuromusa sp.]|nr:WYL domain-containing protein [Desulfuromusa sp.]